MTESDLWGLLQKKDSTALEVLQQRYTPLIRYIIAPILPDERDREECLNDIFLRIWDRIGQFDPAKGNWTPWLSALARNAAIDRARRSTHPAEELTHTSAAPDPDPEQTLLRQERQAALRAALQQLRTDDRALFYRKYYYRQSTAQIAAELGTTVRAVEGRLYRIKTKLRRELGGDNDD